MILLQNIIFVHKFQEIISIFLQKLINFNLSQTLKRLNQ